MQATRGAALDQAADTSPRRPGRPLRLLALVAALVVIADQVSKVAVVATLVPGRPVDVLGSLLRLDLTRNSGAAFSVGTGSTIVFTVVAVVVVIIILRTAGVPGLAPRGGARRLTSQRWAVCLGLLLGGAVGNLIDRLVRGPAPLRGHVVDWIELPHWPVFNIADSAITIGAVAAVLLSLIGVALSSGSSADRSAPSADEDGES